MMLVSAGTIFFMRLQQNDTKPSDTKAASERIIKKVGALYLVPLEETPTVAKIKDKTSLHGNDEFYKDAENGDYVLLYQQAQTALLYRESIDKLVKVSPISTQTNTDSRL